MPQVNLPRIVILVMTLALSACANSSYDRSAIGWLTPYRFDRVQGNVITREQLDILKPGMARMQVRDVLGTPLLTSAFRGDRWDYAFTFSRQGLAPQSRHVAVFFTGDVMDRVEADDVPREADFVAQIRAKKVIDKLPPLEAAPESLQAFVPPTKPAPQMVPPLPDSYPPLESVQ